MPRKLSNVRMLWKSEKILRTDIRGMATVEMGVTLGAKNMIQFNRRNRGTRGNFLYFLSVGVIDHARLNLYLRSSVAHARI